MTTLKNFTQKECIELQELINKVISERKLQFDVETILNITKKEVLNSNINNKILDSYYFYILLLNTLDSFVESGKIYRIRDRKQDKYFYYPYDYIILKNYCSSSIQTRLLYFLADDVEKNINLFNTTKFIDIATSEIVLLNEVSKTDFILCGGFSNEEYQNTLQSDVKFEEITNLFHQFIREGATKSQAINHILNYYKVQKMPRNLSWANDFIITSSKNKKLILK